MDFAIELYSMLRLCYCNKTHSIKMKGKIGIKDLEKLVESGDIDTVLACGVDMQGRLNGKRLTGYHFLKHNVNEWEGCNYLVATDMEKEPVPGYKSSSWDTGYGDMVVKTDLNTLRIIPWLEKTALVLGDYVNHNGELDQRAPRSILKKQIQKLNDMGYLPKIAPELEFYVFNETYESAEAKDFKNLTKASWYNEDYDIFQTTKEEPLIRAMRNGLNDAGIDVEGSKGEASAAQEEMNVMYAEALEMADRHAVMKNGMKEIAYKQGKAITFMAKPFYDLCGNSFHLHSSLWDLKTDKALFCVDGTNKRSDLFKYYLAGQLKLSSQITYFFAPYINSYKRFAEGTFAPTQAVWSYDNRTAGYRILGHGPGLRVECRIPGADANPYLAYAATLAAGIFGIENKLELEDSQKGNMYQANIRGIPKTLREALSELNNSKIMRNLFGDDVIDHYVHAGEWEQFEYDRRITDWELRRYFERG